ncbi:hypothetical protein GPALN_005240 [Globodera pallida]|nr:hypothetical protein GPALN_005240 [Globodera pallida]
MLRPLLLALGCFLLFPLEVVGEEKENGEIASLLSLLNKNDFEPGGIDSKMTYSFAVIIIVLFVLILIAVLFFLIYKICIEHMKLTFLCNVSPSDFTGRGQDSKTSFSIATTL